jgi:general stress protein YciG
MGSKEGAAKSLAKALAKNPNHLKEIQSKGGKSVKRENRAFFRNRELAKIAGSKGGKVSRRT